MKKVGYQLTLGCELELWSIEELKEVIEEYQKTHKPDHSPS